MFKKLNILLYSLCCFFCNAQLPDTDVWLFDMTANKKDGVALKNPLNITNRPGYDNQPSFSADGSIIFYSSVREDGQADIYSYNIKKNKSQQLTKSPESEYSPTPAPDGKLLGTVTVEADSSQKIHFLDPVSGTHVHKLEFDSVGYCAFLNSDTVVYYKLTSPHSLRFHSTATNTDKWLANIPARTFRTINRHTLLYGLKDSLKVMIYKFDFLLSKALKITDTPALNEDMAWNSQFGLVISSENKLMKFENNNWKVLFDLNEFGIKKITRFVFHPANKKLAVVVTR